MSWYDRLLKNSDRTMDFDPTDNFKQDAIKNASFKVKGTAKEGIDITQSNDAVKGASGDYAFKHKTEVVAVCAPHNLKGKLTVNGKETALRLKQHPAGWNANGSHGCWSLDANCAPQSDEWRVKAQLKYGGVELGPITPWTEVSASHH